MGSDRSDLNLEPRSIYLIVIYNSAVRTEYIETENGRGREFGGTNPILDHVRSPCLAGEGLYDPLDCGPTVTVMDMPWLDLGVGCWALRYFAWAS